MNVNSAGTYIILEYTSDIECIISPSIETDPYEVNLSSWQSQWLHGGAQLTVIRCFTMVSPIPIAS